MLTWSDYDRLVHGYDLKRSHGFEGVRAICYFSILPHLEKKDRVSMEEFWPLPTDPKIDKKLEDEQLLALIRQLVPQ